MLDLKWTAADKGAGDSISASINLIFLSGLQLNGMERYGHTHSYITHCLAHQRSPSPGRLYLPLHAFLFHLHILNRTFWDTLLCLRASTGGWNQFSVVSFSLFSLCFSLSSKVSPLNVKTLDLSPAPRIPLFKQPNLPLLSLFFLLLPLFIFTFCRDCSDHSLGFFFLFGCFSGNLGVVTAWRLHKKNPTTYTLCFKNWFQYF